MYRHVSVYGFIVYVFDLCVDVYSQCAQTMKPTPNDVQLHMMTQHAKAPYLQALPIIL